jgi:hypothetical protein
MKNKKKEKTRRACITNPPIRNFHRKPKKKLELPNFIILLHKINIAGMSRQMAEETIARYNAIIQESFEDLSVEVKNIMLPMTTGEESDVRLIYPTTDLSSLDSLESVAGYGRKIRIFKLLEELEDSISNKNK